MAYGRIESTPSEQLSELCKARDRYMAVADQLKANPGPSAMRRENRQRERDARRIAHAYEKSIANMTSKMMRMKPKAPASLFGNLGMASPIFAIGVGALAFLAVMRPGLFEARLARPDAPSATARPAIAGPAIAVHPNIAAVMPKPDAVPQKLGSPVVIATPAAEPRVRHEPARLRPTAARELAQPAARIAKRVDRGPGAMADKDGFVAKVLQPDGTFKEEYFSTSTSR